jgi:hypothetical protein
LEAHKRKNNQKIFTTITLEKEAIMIFYLQNAREDDDDALDNNETTRVLAHACLHLLCG